jgi:hypothetical protein
LVLHGCLIGAASVLLGAVLVFDFSDNRSIALFFVLALIG